MRGTGKKDERIAEPLGGGALTILQNRALPCFSLDACLLAGFCELPQGARVADLCSGTGIIPLLLYLRDKDISVEALELMPEMAEMAADSFALNDLPALHMICGDVKEAASLLPGKFGLVTCNPPYYPLDAARVSADRLRAAARSELFCTLGDVVRAATAIICENGIFALCLPPARGEEALHLLRKYGFAPERQLLVRNDAASPPWLVLIQARFAAEAELEKDEMCVFDAEGRYSPEMRRLSAAWLADMPEK